MIAEPIRTVAIRYACPFCSRTRSSRKATAEHITRCWYNPAVRACKTCEHFDPGSDGCWGDPMCNCASGEACRVGVVLPVTGLMVRCEKWQAES